METSNDSFGGHDPSVKTLRKNVRLSNFSRKQRTCIKCARKLYIKEVQIIK